MSNAFSINTFTSLETRVQTIW